VAFTASTRALISVAFTQYSSEIILFSVKTTLLELLKFQYSSEIILGMPTREVLYRAIAVSIFL